MMTNSLYDYSKTTADDIEQLFKGNVHPTYVAQIGRLIIDNYCPLIKKLRNEIKELEAGQEGVKAIKKLIKDAVNDNTK